MFGSLLFLLAQITWVNAPPAGSLVKGATHHAYFSASMGHDVG